MLDIESAYAAQYTTEHKIRRLVFSRICLYSLSTRRTSAELSFQCLNAERVNSSRIVGIVVSDRLTVTEHVNNLVSSCSSLLYALRVLRSHGIPVTARRLPCN